MCLQISDILLMSDFKLRFAHCNSAGDASSCEFSRVREGLIVSLLSIGTLIGALFGAPYVLPLQTFVFISLMTADQNRRFLWPSERHVLGVRCIHSWSNHSGYHILLLGSDHDWSVHQRPRCWWTQRRCPYRLSTLSYRVPGSFSFSRFAVPS